MPAARAAAGCCCAVHGGQSRATPGAGGHRGAAWASAGHDRTVFVTAVLCPDHEAFVGWCRTNRYTVAGDGAEGASGRWLALRVLDVGDLGGVTIDRIDYAVGFWRAPRAMTTELDAFARTRLRRRAHERST